MTDAPQIYVQGTHDNAEDAPRPYGDDTWEVVDENEGGVVAYAGSHDLAILIRDAIRKGYHTFKVGDRIRTLHTQEVSGYGLQGGMRGVIVSVESTRIGFLTHEEVEDGNTYPWWAQPEHIELDK